MFALIAKHHWHKHNVETWLQITSGLDLCWLTAHTASQRTCHGHLSKLLFVGTLSPSWTINYIYDNQYHRFLLPKHELGCIYLLGSLYYCSVKHIAFPNHTAYTIIIPVYRSCFKSCDFCTRFCIFTGTQSFMYRN